MKNSNSRRGYILLAAVLSKLPDGIFSHLSEDQVGATLVGGGHAPHQEHALAEEVAGEEVQQGVHNRLYHREDGEHHPVAHPGQPRLPVVAHDGVEALVGGVQEPHPRPYHPSLAAGHGHQDIVNTAEGNRGYYKMNIREFESPSVTSASSRAQSSLAPAPAGQCQLQAPVIVKGDLEL